MDFDDEDANSQADSENLPAYEGRTVRAPAKDRPLARRLIEQAWEQQQLSKTLADFDDYVV